MNHYFIGKVLNNNDARKLNGPQSFIARNVPAVGKVNKFNTKYAYLGYMDEQTMLELQNKISNVLESITEKYGPQTCTLLNYDITGLKTTKKSIAVTYKCNNISNIIAPYIKSYTDKLTNTTDPFYPHISLLRIDANDVNQVLKKDDDGKNILDKTNLPKQNTFITDSIDIIKGTPIIKRMGQPSKYDDMKLEVINRYTLRGNK